MAVPSHSSTERKLPKFPTALVITLHFLMPDITMGAFVTKGKTPMRLVNGVESTGLYNGRLEVLYNGTWGAVCKDGVDVVTATAICRMFNYSQGSVVFYGGYLRYHHTVWLDDVVCHEAETEISQCSTRGWGSYNCYPNDYLALECRSAEDSEPPNEASIRLVNGTQGDGWQTGRLEVFYDNIWGTVVNTRYFGSMTPRVICGLLGFRRGISISNVKFGQGVGRIWMDIVECKDGITNIGQCSHAGWGRHITGHDKDIGLVCYDSLPSGPTPIRLVDGDKGPGWETGRLEVSFFGYWGTVCLRVTPTPLCERLGYRYGNFLGGSEFGNGDGLLWLYEPLCFQNETDLLQCGITGIWHPCLDNHHVGLICSNSTQDSNPCLLSSFESCGPEDGCYRKTKRCDGSAQCPNSFDESNCQPATTMTPHIGSPGQLRLVNGPKDWSERKAWLSGRLEVFYKESWGAVCSEIFDPTTASTICRHMGFRTGTPVPKAAYGQGSGKIWLGDLKCSGSETNIGECSHGGWGKHNCDHDDDIGLLCYNTMQTAPQSSLLENRAQFKDWLTGRPSYLRFGQQSAVCDKGFSKETAAVICRMNRFRFGNYIGGAAFGRGSGIVWSDRLNCTGEEMLLSECAFGGWDSSECDHSQDVGVICFNSTPDSNPCFLQSFQSCGPSAGCFRVTDRCNGVNNCANGCDELDCGSEVTPIVQTVESFNCDFEEENMCGYTVVGEDPTWVNVRGTALLDDHTFKNATGHFLRVESPSPSTDYAILKSPMIRPRTSTSCLQFYFYQGNIQHGDWKGYVGAWAVSSEYQYSEAWRRGLFKEGWNVAFARLPPGTVSVEIQGTVEMSVDDLQLLKDQDCPRIGYN